MDNTLYSREIFAKSFLVTRMWEVIFNRQSDEGDLTLKQLMLLIVVKNAFESDPTVKEVAQALTTSHQNVKSLLQQLEKKAFVELYRDLEDKRITRIRVPDQKATYWSKRDEKDKETLNKLLEGVSPEDLKTVTHVINQLADNAQKLL